MSSTGGRGYRTGVPAIGELRCGYPSLGHTDSGLGGGGGVRMADNTVVLSLACSYSRGRVSNVGNDRYKRWASGSSTRATLERSPA